MLFTQLYIGSKRLGRSKYMTQAHLSKIEETKKDMEQHLLVHQLILSENKSETHYRGAG